MKGCDEKAFIKNDFTLDDERWRKCEGIYKVKAPFFFFPSSMTLLHTWELKTVPRTFRRVETFDFPHERKSKRPVYWALGNIVFVPLFFFFLKKSKIITVKIYETRLRIRRMKRGYLLLVCVLTFKNYSFSIFFLPPFHLIYVFFKKFHLFDLILWPKAKRCLEN